ncbi:hypothetical protein [Pseudomonas sp. S1_E04]
MATSIEKVLNSAGGEIPDNGSTQRKELTFIGTAGSAGILQIKDGQQGLVLGSSEVQADASYEVTVTGLAAKTYAFVAEVRGSNAPSNIWTVTITQ